MSSPAAAAANSDLQSVHLDLGSVLGTTSDRNSSGESLLNDNMDFSLTSLKEGGGVGGLKDTTMEGNVTGLSLCLVREFEAICGGEVGSTGCGCVLDTFKCSKLKHQRAKVSWPDAPALFLRGRTGTVYLEPSLSIAMLNSVELSSLLQTKFTSETWAEKVNCQGFAARAGTSEHEAKFVLNAAKSDFMTPARNTKRQQVVFDDSLSALRATGNKTRKMNPLLDTIEEKAAELIATRSSEGEIELSLVEVLPLIYDIARRLDNQAIAEGSRDEHAAASSAYVKSEFADVNSMIGALSGDIAVLKALIGKRSSDLESDGNIFEILTTFEKVLKTSGVELAAKANTPMATRALLTTVLAPYKAAIQNLGPQVGSLENELAKGQGGANTNLPSTQQATGATNHTTTAARDMSWESDVEAQLAVLTRMASGNGNVGDKGVNFAGQVFANCDELRVWFEDKEGHTNLPMSLFQCHLTMLHRVYTLITGGQRELRDVKVMSDLKVRDHCVNAFQAMNRGGLPLILKGDKNSPLFTGLDTGGPKSRFGNIPTYARFGEPNDHDAMRHKIIAGLSEVYKTIQNDIDCDLKHSDVKALAYKMAQRTQEFCLGLIQFFTDTYQDYIHSFGDTTKTWDFVCLCVEKILTTEFAEARTLACGMDLAQPRYAVKMIWASLRIVSVQERFLDIGIANHPILSSTCSRYLIKNSGLSGVEEFKKQAKKNSADIADLEAVIMELKNQVKSATSLADKATSALKKVTADLAKQGGKK